MTTKQKLLRHAFAAFCILAAGAGTSGIAAARAPDRATIVRSVVVRYNGSDLSSERGSEMVYARLRIAASAVCGRVGFRDDVAASAWQTCYRTALDKAVAELGNARVKALHEEGARRHPRK